MIPSIVRIVMSTISAAGMVPKTSVSRRSICVDIDAGSFLVLTRLRRPNRPTDARIIARDRGSLLLSVIVFKHGRMPAATLDG